MKNEIRQQQIAAILARSLSRIRLQPQPAKTVKPAVQRGTAQQDRSVADAQDNQPKLVRSAGGDQ